MQKSVLILHHTTMRCTAGTGFESGASDDSVLAEVKPVCEAVGELGYKHKTVGIAHITQLPQVLAGKPGTTVFNLVEDLAGEPADYCSVPAICRCFGAACTGNGTAAMLLAQDKWRAKAVLKAAGLPVPDGFVVPVGQKAKNILGPGTYIVKPLFCDASEGIDSDSIVRSPGPAMQRAVERVHTQLKQPVLVERFVPSREFNVSVLQNGPQVRALPVAEIDFGAYGDRPHIVDYDAKWVPQSFTYQNSPRILPADLPQKTAGLIRDYAIAAWEVLGCRGFARVDFRMDEDGGIFIIEVNPNPDISPDAGFAAALSEEGIGFREFIGWLINDAASQEEGGGPRGLLDQLCLQDGRK